ncbi:deoxyribodipyrimidine photo-lyase [Buchnera aphidicola (Mindarus keteleerifoliae)]|uniref:deoxyribodipyrimidine photo-lyase n=1 Tax=Buchnera aphidicola TaxID=9 RepID=UPI0031B72655
MNINLVWFRNDLRVRDNTALFKACRSKEDKIVAIYIATPKQWKSHNMSPKQSFFIYKNLLLLEKKLFLLKIPFFYFEISNFDSQILFLVEFCKKKNIHTLFYNKQYEINEIKRDQKIKKILNSKKINMIGYHDSILISPNLIFNSNKKSYIKYTPFKNKIFSYLNKKKIRCFPVPDVRSIKEKEFSSKIFSFTYPKEKFSTKLFPIGENNAIKKLNFFLNQTTMSYSLTRNFFGMNSTSFLSPYLSIGILSPRQCLSAIFKEKISFESVNNDKITWVEELIWREFYKHTMNSYSLISKEKSIFHWEKEIKWNNNKKHFSLWKKGLTGYPIIDAAMRQLNQLGWMHNRLRMITASFLTKNLLIDWRKGAKYFMSKLIDGDFSSNIGGWQWAASVGFDSVPYFRFFNPLIQSKKFDPNGKFIYSFIPELRKVPINFIHDLQRWREKNPNTIDYPHPIVNYKLTKKEFCEKIKKAKNSF